MLTSPRLCFCATALWLISGFPTGAQEPVTSTSESGLDSFGKMVPEGFVNRGVRIPSFSDGKLRSLVLAGSVTRLDDQRLFAEKLLLTFYGAQNNKDVQVNLNTAYHHLGDQLLRSTEHSRVSRSDFELTGDAMVFDAAHSIGRMRGHVRSIIFDINALADKTQPAGSARK